MKKQKIFMIISLMLFVLLVPANVPAMAANTITNTPSVSAKTNTTKPSASKKGRWVKKKKDTYYCLPTGKYAKKGIFKIGTKKYCFDKKGRQLTGWRKVGRYIYYFKQASGAKGYMVTNKNVDGIRLKANGRAKAGSKRAKAKLPLLVSARKLADKIVGRGPKSIDKLEVCFYYLRDHYSIYWTTVKQMDSPVWDIEYAKETMSRRSGDCYGFASTFAYLAHALGYKDTTLVANGHCWVRINGRYFDPFWVKEYGEKYEINAFNIPREKCNKNNMFHTDWARDGAYFKACKK